MSAELQYFFRHALLQEAAYQLMLPSIRSSLHIHALRLLDDGSPSLDLNRALELAEHARRARDGCDESLHDQLKYDESRYSLQAASQANRLQQNAIVLAQVDRILGLAVAEPLQRYQALELRAQAALRAGKLAQALDAEESRLAAALTDEQRLEACLGAAHAAMLLQERVRGDQFTKQAEGLAAKCDSPRLNMALWNHRSRAAYYANDFAAALECNARADEAGRGLEISRQHIAIKANRQLYLSSLGRHDDALACADDAARLATSANDNDMLSYIMLYKGHTLMRLKQWPQAAQTLGEGERAARKAGARLRLAENAYRRALCKIALAEFHSALDLTQSVLRIAREIGSADLVQLGVYGQAVVLRCSGRYEECLAVCVDGCAELEGLRSRPSENIQIERAAMMSRMGACKPALELCEQLFVRGKKSLLDELVRRVLLAEIMLDGGRATRAYELLLPAAQSSYDDLEFEHESVWLHGLLAEACLALGRPEEAEKWARRGSTLGQQRNLPADRDAPEWQRFMATLARLGISYQPAL